uniref:Uncharacterized protein n=1 Tax=Tanacetum cinerariifolium TaxID=118510 RepID=A0A699K5Y7_TANCI|nr:hypothetical protein [Tanacetum cinerariifolium]
MNEAVQVAVRLQSDRLHEEAQKENDEFLKTVDENIKKIIKESSHSSRTSYDVAVDLPEMELKKILIEKMEGNKSIQRSDAQRNLYKALVDAYESDKILLDTYGETVTLKRRRDDDEDKDEKPFAGPDRGSKRRREGKEPKSASTPSDTATKSADISTTWSRSRLASASESAFAEEPVQTTSQMEEPSHPEFETGADDQPIVQSSQHPEWFSQPQKPPTLDCGSCKSLIELEYHLEEVYKATTDQLDWVNPEGQQYLHNLLQPLPLKPDNRGRRVIPFAHFINNDIEYLRGEFALGVYSKRRIIAVTNLKIVEWHSYKHLDWITVRRKLTNLTVEERFAFNVSHRMFTRSIVIQRRVKNLQLGVKSYQKRLNLTKPDTYRSDLKRREAYTAYSNPRGFIYQNKDKKNRLMRIDKLYKFSDRTLNDVRTALDDRLKGIRMQYLP